MNDVMRLLSSEDKLLIDDYICCFANESYEREISRRASIDTILHPWAQAKSGFLSTPFVEANSLIIKENINYVESLEETTNKIESNPAINQFIGAVDQYFSERWKFLSENEREVYHCVFELLRCDYLATNEYNGKAYTLQYPDDPTRKIVIPKKCKPVKMLGKINSIFKITELYESFRIAHSMILNDTKLHGELCISIHPLDYMTMSDNDCDWTSCMSWRDDGSYRLGTVEMMNSSVVVVAYLTSSTSMRFFDNEWNNKKWRCLFIVTPQLITSIKGYPYNNHNLNITIINKLRELYNTVNYNKPIQYNYYGRDSRSLYEKNLIFHTGHMYNDFGTVDHDGCISDKFTTEELEILYSGESTCMWCGNTIDSSADDSNLICEDCSSLRTCYDCGCSYNTSDLTYLDHYGTYVCNSCLNNYVQEYISGDYYLGEDASKLAIIPSKYKEEFESILNSNNSNNNFIKWNHIIQSILYVYLNVNHPSNIIKSYFGEAKLNVLHFPFYADLYVYSDDIPKGTLKDIQDYLDEEYKCQDYFEEFDSVVERESAVTTS